MNFLQLKETIAQAFPTFGEKQIGIVFNRAYKEFVSKTRLLEASIDLTMESSAWETININWETDNKRWGINIYYDLGDDIVSIFEIIFKDDQNNIIDIAGTPIKFYEIKKRKLFLYLENLNQDLTSFYNNYNITIYYYKIPDALVNDLDTIVIDEEFEEAILNKVFQILSAKNKQFKEAIYYYSLYKDWIREGKKAAANHLDNIKWEVYSPTYPGLEKDN